MWAGAVCLVRAAARYGPGSRFSNRGVYPRHLSGVPHEILPGDVRKRSGPRRRRQRGKRWVQSRPASGGTDV
jgi:hypothetical protein